MKTDLGLSMTTTTSGVLNSELIHPECVSTVRGITLFSSIKCSGSIFMTSHSLIYAIVLNDPFPQSVKST